MSYSVREHGSTMEREMEMLVLFPCCYSYLYHFEHSTSYRIHNSGSSCLFQAECAMKYSSLIHVPTAVQKQLNSVSRIISVLLPSNMFPKVITFSHALSSVLPHNSSRWQLESSVLLLCAGSWSGKNVLLFIK